MFSKNMCRVIEFEDFEVEVWSPSGWIFLDTNRCENKSISVFAFFLSSFYRVTTKHRSIDSARWADSWHIIQKSSSERDITHNPSKIDLILASLIHNKILENQNVCWNMKSGIKKELTPLYIIPKTSCLNVHISQTTVRIVLGMISLESPRRVLSSGIIQTKIRPVVWKILPFQHEVSGCMEGGVNFFFIPLHIWKKWKLEFYSLKLILPVCDALLGITCQIFVKISLV